MSSESTAKTISLLLLALLAGCADFSRGKASAKDGGGEGGGAAGNAGGGRDGALSYATSIAPLLATCQRCHAAGQQAGDTQLVLSGNPAADYDMVVPLIDTSAPASSRLLAKMSGQGHGGGTIYAAGSPEYETVLAWIQQGAPQ